MSVLTKYFAVTSATQYRTASTPSALQHNNSPWWGMVRNGEDTGINGEYFTCTGQRECNALLITSMECYCEIAIFIANQAMYERKLNEMEVKLEHLEELITKLINTVEVMSCKSLTKNMSHVIARFYSRVTRRTGPAWVNLTDTTYCFVDNLTLEDEREKTCTTPHAELYLITSYLTHVKFCFSSLLDISVQ